MIPLRRRRSPHEAPNVAVPAHTAPEAAVPTHTAPEAAELAHNKAPKASSLFLGHTGLITSMQDPPLMSV